MGTIQQYKDYEFHKIECMISICETELGFFKNDNDVRPSQATYIKKEDAEHLYKIFIQRLYVACSKVNKKLNNDKSGSYEWNELLLEELN